MRVASYGCRGTHSFLGRNHLISIERNHRVTISVFVAAANLDEDVCQVFDDAIAGELLVCVIKGLS